MIIFSKKTENRNKSEKFLRRATKIHRNALRKIFKDAEEVKELP